MTDTKMLIGSLSNDLLRVANLTQRGSLEAAKRFLSEAKRWAIYSKQDVKEYVYNIAEEVKHTSAEQLDIAMAEKFLMYSILLQNYALHME